MLKKSNYRVYYFFIIFLALMLFVPPILRLTMPKDNKEISGTESKANIVKEQQLICEITKLTRDKAITITTYTNYKNTKLQNITFNFEGLDEKSKVDFGQYYDMKNILVNVKGAEQTSDSSVIFDFTNNKTYNEEYLNNYSKSINEQQKYYEDNGYECIIVE